MFKQLGFDHVVALVVCLFALTYLLSGLYLVMHRERGGSDQPSRETVTGSMTLGPVTMTAGGTQPGGGGFVIGEPQHTPNVTLYITGAGLGINTQHVLDIIDSLSVRLQELREIIARQADNKIGGTDPD